MGPGEGDFVVSGKESRPGITAQRTGEKPRGSFIFPVSPGLFLQGFFFPVSCSKFFCWGFCGSGAGN